MIQGLAVCSFEGARWLFFGSGVPLFVYYSHVPNIVLSLSLAFFVLFQNKKALPGKILFSTLIAFVVWAVFALMFWASNRSDVIMFAWSIDILVEPLVYMGVLYLLYVLIDKKDISFKKKLLPTALYVPIPALLFTTLTLSGFDVVNCLAIEGPIALYYTYFVEIFCTLWIVGLCCRRYFTNEDKQHKKEILFLGFGAVLFLLAFSWGNIVGSFTEDWVLGQYGLFGMPIFVSFLVYSIVKFGTFNIRLIGSFALVFALAALNFSLIFLRDVNTFRLVTILTFVFTLVLGTALIKSILKSTREQQRIAELNKARSDFLNVASHQLRTPVSVITGNLSMLVEGDYDKASHEELKNVYGSMFHKAKKLTSVVNGILMAARMDSFDDLKLSPDARMSTVDLRALAKDVCETLKEKAEGKGINLDYSSIVSSGSPVPVNGSANYLEQSISNLVDNAINYTQKGFVRVTLSQADKMLQLQIADSGIGIPLEDQNRLFKRFERGKNAQNAYTDGSGLGLFVVKKMIEAHPGGRVSFASEGEGKGTTFTIEMKTL